MRIDRWLISGGSIMLLAAFVGLLFSPPQHILADSSCTSTECYFTDTTLSDFVQGSFYATGLANIGDGAVQLLPMGLTSPWITDTYHLPGSRVELAAVIYHDIIYAIGGSDQSSNRNEIFSAATYITGEIKPPGWITLSETIPTPMAGMSAVISPTQSGAILYVIGGYYLPQGQSSSVPTSTISYHSLDSNGTFTGNWTISNTALPTVLASSPPAYGLYYTEAIVRNGNLYVIGGTSDGHDNSPYIYRYPILDSIGTLGNVVTETEQIPNGIYSSGVATWTDANGTDFLYVTGGQQDANTAVARVPYTHFDSSDSPVAFTDNNSDILPSVLTQHGMVQGNGKLFLTGGQEGNPPAPSNKVQSALIDPTGAPHYWSGNPWNSDWIVTRPLPEPRSRHASVINSGGEVYVIGGWGPSGETDTVYHGSTSGFGNQYAPQGNYLSRIINLGALRNITSINIGSTITNPVTMTVQYRSGTSTNDFANPSAGWTNLPGGLQAGVDVNTSFGANLTASYIQYRAFFTSSVSNLSPSLNSFQVQYPPPPALPDFAVTGMQAPQSPGTLTTETITITVYGKRTGLAPARVIGSPLRAPRTQISGRWKPPPPPPRLGSQLRSPTTSNTIYWFWVTFYADPNQVPKLPTDISSNNGAMNCVDGSHNQPKFPPFVYYPDDFLYISNPLIYWASCAVPANAKNFYAQIDTCDSGTTNSQPNDPNCNYYGYWLERDEVGNNPGYADNIIGPVPAGSSRGGGTGGLILFLPFTSKQ